MIATLYVNGCSWTSGNELEYDPKFEEYIQQLGLRKEDPRDWFNWNLLDKDNNRVSTFEQHYDNFNWAGELQRNLNIPQLINHSVGGASNHRILRTTLEYIRSRTPGQLSDTLIVIGWTGSTRNELYINNAWQRYNLTQPFRHTYDAQSPMSQEHIQQIEKMQELYTVYAHDDYADIYEYFTDIYLLSNTLDNLGVKYLFFNALPAWWEAGDQKVNCNVWESFPNQIQHHNTHNNIMHFNDSMFHFVNNHKYPVAEYLHPLAQAHTDWSKYLNTQLTTRNII